MTEPRRPPNARFGPGYDGMLDPERLTPAELHATSRERLVEERNRRNSPSTVVRRLQAATDRTFRRLRGR